MNPSLYEGGVQYQDTKLDQYTSIVDTIHNTLRLRKAAYESPEQGIEIALSRQLCFQNIEHQTDLDGIIMMDSSS